MRLIHGLGRDPVVLSLTYTGHCRQEGFLSRVEAPVAFDLNRRDCTSVLGSPRRGSSKSFHTFISL